MFPACTSACFSVVTRGVPCLLLGSVQHCPTVSQLCCLVVAKENSGDGGKGECVLVLCYAGAGGEMCVVAKLGRPWADLSEPSHALAHQPSGDSAELCMLQMVLTPNVPLHLALANFNSDITFLKVSRS